MQDLDAMDSMEKMLIQKAYQRQAPINGSLELLPLCNMNCDMCYVRLSKAEMEQKGRLRTKEEWITLARQMKDAGTLFLLLTGGEPLLFPEFKELYVELQNMGMILTINTNGTLINEICTQCKYRPICNTCVAAALLETGDYEGIPEYICDYTKEFYKIMKERR